MSEGAAVSFKEMNRVTYRAGSEVSQGLLISSSLTVLPLPVEFVPSPSSVRSSVIRRIRAMICRDLFNETKRRNDSFMRRLGSPLLSLSVFWGCVVVVVVVRVAVVATQTNPAGFQGGTHTERSAHTDSLLCRAQMLIIIYG